jgi:hypothetical protein
VNAKKTKRFNVHAAPALVAAAPLLCGIMEYRRARMVATWSVAVNLLSSNGQGQRERVADF